MPGALLIERLMRRLVNDKAVDAVQEFLSAVGFSVAGDQAQAAAEQAVIDSAAARFCP